MSVKQAKKWQARYWTYGKEQAEGSSVQMLADVMRDPGRYFGASAKSTTHTVQRDGYMARYATILSHAVVFEVSDVARFVRAQDERKLPHEALPNVAPLAPYMWFEYDGVAVDLPGQRFGCLLTLDDERDGWQGSKWEGIEISAETRWIVRAVYFGHVPQGLSCCGWIYLLSIGDDGALLGMRSFPNPTAIECGRHPDEAERQCWHEEIAVALTAVCFAHCKGTTLVDHQQPRQQRRAAEREGRSPLVTYKTLDIAPATRVLREQGQIEKTGIKRALHLCRGHFARYTDEKPLFGKYTGTFYIPMHMRGRPEQGAVVKDYRVLAPTQAEARMGG